MNTQNSDSKNDSNNRKLYIQFPYSSAIEEQMPFFYQLLSEKDRRLYAATEALKLGHGGIRYIAKVLNCDRKTIHRGISELKHSDNIENDGIRTKGAAKKYATNYKEEMQIKFDEKLGKWNYRAVPIKA